MSPGPWRWTASALFAVLAAGSLAPAGERPEASPPVEEPHPSYQTATGTMSAYDPETRELTVRSATGSAVYRVAPDARAWLGRRGLPLEQLVAHVGAQVTLAWAEVEAVPTTHTIRLFERHAPRGP